MSKPLYFTGRREIAREDIMIRLFDRPGRTSSFGVTVDLTEYHLPSDAGVVVEAYHNTYYQRFSVGTVTSLKGECIRELSDLEPGDRPHFRVKVISQENFGTGKLLAAIDVIRPETEDDTGSGTSLLPLSSKNREQMGDEFWRVNFVQAGDEVQPELWINGDVNGLFAALQSQDPRVAAFIMPEVFRQVLRRLVECSEAWTEEGITGQWLAFAKSFGVDQFEDSDEDGLDSCLPVRREWVDEVVQRFAASHRLFDRFHEHSQPSTD